MPFLTQLAWVPELSESRYWWTSKTWGLVSWANMSFKGGELDVLRLSVLPSGLVTAVRAAAEPPDTNCVPPV